MKKYISILILFSILFVQNAVFAIQREDISVSITQQALKSRLKKEYNGYLYEIKNISKGKINIVNAQIVNGTNGNVAYNAVAEGGGKSVGILWAICGPAGLFSFGIGWLVGLVSTPIVWVVGNKKDKKTRNESAIYTNMVTLGELNRSESISVLTLVPIGAQSQLKISIYDEKTKDYQSFVY